MSLRYEKNQHMRPSGNIYTLSHHWALGIPGIGETLYGVQWVLLQSPYWHHLWVSRRKSIGKVAVTDFLKQHASCIMCTSVTLSETLKMLPGKEIVFAADIEEDPIAMSREQLQNLLWTLVYCTRITKAAKGNVSSFIPRSFPVFQGEWFEV